MCKSGHRDRAHHQVLCLCRSFLGQFRKIKDKNFRDFGIEFPPPSRLLLVQDTPGECQRDKKHLSFWIVHQAFGLLPQNVSLAKQSLLGKR
jgi:hypothetical protein